MSYADYSLEREADVKLAVAEAIEARKQAVTFKTAVGACAITKDGRLFPGFNIESYGYMFELHAEQSCVLRAMFEGYRTTDFAAVVIVFQSGWSDKVETYAGCPYCWAFLNQFTHPDLLLVIATPDGKILREVRFQDIFTLDLKRVYPSETYKAAKPIMGMNPKL